MSFEQRMFIICICLAGMIASAFITKAHTEQIITARIYERWGEGDMGLEINDYIITGDSSGIDLIEENEPNL